MRKRWRILALVLVLGPGVAVLAVWLLRPPTDPAADPALTRPPALVQARELGGRALLFDGRTTAGWRIEGPHHVSDGTLELGGPEPTRGTLDRPLAAGDRVEFDFFQEGPGGAVLWVRPELLDPQPPDPEFRRDIPVDLDLSGFVYRRWHAVAVRAGQDGGTARLTTTFRAHHDGVGRGGGGSYSLPARGGARHQLDFRVPTGAKLYLRNVLVGPGAG